MPAASKTRKSASPIGIKDRLKAGGLKLKASDIRVLEEMGPEIDQSAAAIRKPRSYFEEPVHTLRLRSA